MEVIKSKSKNKSKKIEIDYTPFSEESNIIRCEMNIIELSLFSKNRKIEKNVTMKYLFDRKKDSYLEIIPLQNEKIPGEFDQRVFFTLMKLYRENGFKQIVYFDYYTFISSMEIAYNGKNLKKLKNSLNKLSSTTYVFNNCFYSNLINKQIEDEIRTNILTMRTIKFKKEEKIEKQFAKFFRNSKIKEIVEIKLSSHFFNNIVTKGFLRFDNKILLEMTDTIARDIYQKITKWRNKKLYLKLFTQDLAGRIPLSFNKNTRTNTIERLKKSFDYLEKNNHINNYTFEKNQKNEFSYFEIYFKEEHNFDYYTDIKIKTGHENMIIKEVKEKLKILELSENIRNQIIKTKRNLYFLKAYNEKFERYIIKISEDIEEKLIIDSLSAIYRDLNTEIKKDLVVYFKTVINNKKEKKKEEKKKEKEVIEAEIVEEKKEEKEKEIIKESDEKLKIVKNMFEFFDDEKKKEIINKAYKNYIKDAGVNDNKIQERIFNSGEVRFKYIHQLILA